MTLIERTELFGDDWGPGSYMFRNVKIENDVVERHLAFTSPNGVFSMIPLTAKGWTLVSENPLTISPSIWINQGRGGEREWHGFITDGEFVTC